MEGSKSLKIGWIGIGVMGKSMADHLIKNGYKLQVYNRTESKAAELVEAGAEFKDPIEIAKEADYIFIMLGYPHDVEEVVLHEEKGLLKHMKSGATLIDHTTSSPGLAVRIYEEAKKKNVKALDAPVSGGDIGAKNGKLVVMVGGDKDGLEPIMEIL